MLGSLLSHLRRPYTHMVRHNMTDQTQTANCMLGFPYPENVALASLLESVVRVNGGVPATIGILDGVVRVGMDPEELIRLTESAGKSSTLKLSRRDLAYVCGQRLVGKNYNGGTTISSTMLLAHLAGIKVFGTGGLGGVHRGAESSMDISADLTELGRTPVTVVSSGCKSFLDIPRTLEYLETEGAYVGTFADGRQGNVDFPAFWSRDSGVKSPTTVQNEIEAAAIIRTSLKCPPADQANCSRRATLSQNFLRIALRKPCSNRECHSKRNYGHRYRRSLTPGQCCRHYWQRQYALCSC